MGLVAHYEKQLSDGLLNADAEQAAVIAQLAAITTELTQHSGWKPRGTSFLSRLFRSTDNARAPVKGLYLWGGVGRGKTRLCDMFYEQAPFEDKYRLHFHRFMQRIHSDLRALGPIENPLLKIADDWASRTRLLLLDEMHVYDITDAMLLGGLLTALFERRVTLVTTSNVPPSDLYSEGLQRARFLPAIATIEVHTSVREMIGDTDYRLRLLEKEPTYIVIDNHGERDAERALQAHFDRLRVGAAHASGDVDVLGRTLTAIACSDDVVWFDFKTLCDSPRSTHDYIDLASRFSTVLLSDIPVLNDQRNDAARRLVNLIDEFYDRGVKLIATAAASPDALYSGKRLAFEFVRAASRLTEMQTTAYLGRPRTPH